MSSILCSGSFATCAAVKLERRDANSFTGRSMFDCLELRFQGEGTLNLVTFYAKTQKLRHNAKPHSPQSKHHQPGKDWTHLILVARDLATVRNLLSGVTIS